MLQPDQQSPLQLLPDDILGKFIPYLTPGSFISLMSTCRRFRTFFADANNVLFKLRELAESMGYSMETFKKFSLWKYTQQQLEIFYQFMITPGRRITDKMLDTLGVAIPDCALPHNFLASLSDHANEVDSIAILSALPTLFLEKLSEIQVISQTGLRILISQSNIPMVKFKNILRLMHTDDTDDWLDHVCDTYMVEMMNAFKQITGVPTVLQPDFERWLFSNTVVTGNSVHILKVLVALIQRDGFEKVSNMSYSFTSLMGTNTTLRNLMCYSLEQIKQLDENVNFHFLNLPFIFHKILSQSRQLELDVSKLNAKVVCSFDQAALEKFMVAYDEIERFKPQDIIDWSNEFVLFLSHATPKDVENCKRKNWRVRELVSLLSAAKTQNLSPKHLWFLLRLMPKQALMTLLFSTTLSNHALLFIARLSTLPENDVYVTSAITLLNSFSSTDQLDSLFNRQVRGLIYLIIFTIHPKIAQYLIDHPELLHHDVPLPAFIGLLADPTLLSFPTMCLDFILNKNTPELLAEAAECDLGNYNALSLYLRLICANWETYCVLRSIPASEFKLQEYLDNNGTTVFEALKEVTVCKNIKLSMRSFPHGKLELLGRILGLTLSHIVTLYETKLSDSDDALYFLGILTATTVAPSMRLKFADMDELKKYLADQYKTHMKTITFKSQAHTILSSSNNYEQLVKQLETLVSQAKLELTKQQEVTSDAPMPNP